MQGLKSKLTELLNNSDDFVCEYEYLNYQNEISKYSFDEGEGDFLYFVMESISSTETRVILDNRDFYMDFVDSWCTYVGEDPTNFYVYKFWEVSKDECVYLLVDQFYDSWGGNYSDPNWYFAEPVYVRQKAYKYEGLDSTRLFLDTSIPSLSQIID